MLSFLKNGMLFYIKLKSLLYVILEKISEDISRDTKMVLK